MINSETALQSGMQVAQMKKSMRLNNWFTGTDSLKIQTIVSDRKNSIIKAIHISPDKAYYGFHMRSVREHINRLHAVNPVSGFEKYSSVAGKTIRKA